MIGDKYIVVNKEEEEKEKRKQNAYSRIRRYCRKCGHANYVLKQWGKVFCSHCGVTVYYDEKEEFKDKLLKKMAQRGDKK